MTKSNPSLTSITPANAGERNFVNFHRNNTDEPLDKDLADDGKNGINNASSKVKTFPRKKFRFGNDMKQSISDYDPVVEAKSGTELARKHHFGRLLNKKHYFINASNKKSIDEAVRKDQLPDIEKYYNNRMLDKMDKQMRFQGDQNDPDYRGEISFHHAMRAWAARQRIASPPHVHGDEGRGYGKRIAKFSKEMIKRAKERKSDNSYARNESLIEHLPANASVKNYIDDFQKSDNPRFAGKSAEERRKMAIAAWYSRNESLNEVSRHKLFKYIKKTEPSVPSEDTHSKGRHLAKDKLGYGTHRAKVMASEGEVVYLNQDPRYRNKVNLRTRYDLSGKNANNERIRKQAERLGYIKDKYPKPVSEFIDPHTAASVIGLAASGAGALAAKYGVDAYDKLKDKLKKKKVQKEALAEKINLVKMIVVAEKEQD